MNISLRKSVSRLLLVALLLGCVLSLPAQQVTQEVALKKAEQFLGKASLSRRVPHKAPQLTLANNRNEFYVFNDKANGGYVVVSGEERMPDVLAYSYDSRFDADNMPCNMKAWLEGYAEQVKYLRTHPEASARRTTPERKNVDPMLTCWFHQSSPYNDKCPEVDGKRCHTGCVATAMAQIMYYWKWPKQTTDVIPGYTTSTHKIEMPEIPVTTIDWDNMLGAYYYNDYTEKQADAISTLMLLCGTSVEMNYTPTGSGAGSCSYALPKYFNYDDMLESVSRNGCKIEDWEQLIYDEMKSKRPVLYDGFPTDGSGHAFVLDGYQDGYFHVNWGGGEGSESYVLMTDAEGWKGYTEYQGAVVGIQPPASEDNPSRYAVIDNGKMTLYYDKKKSSRSGTVLVHKGDWVNYKEEITECVIDESFANLKQRNMFKYFNGLENLKSIKGIENLKTSEAMDMGMMFGGCSALTELDLSSFKTDKVTDMGGMFYGCSALTELDLSSFKTDKVTNMNGMFYNCPILTELDLSSFKTDRVTNMFRMFSGCSGLTSLDVSGFKTDNVTEMSWMFDGCSSLTSLDVSGFKTDNVTSMNNMFANCSNLTELDVSGFKTDNVIRMNYMFYNCSNLTKLDVSGFKTDNVTTMTSMFSGCSGLTSLDVSGFKTDNVTTMLVMFANCSNLTELDVSGFKTDNVKDMRSMFSGCSGLTSLDVSGFKTDNVTDMGYMFAYCYELSTIYASERWNMDNVEYTDDMFYGCSKIVGGEGTTYDPDHTNNDYARIDEGPSNPGYFTRKAPQFYTITYMVDDEEYVAHYLKVGVTITAEEEPTKEGYTFSGWSEIPETMPAHDVTVTGTFSVNKYKLIYMVDGEEYKTSEVEYGTTITAEEEPTKEGYTFSGWSEIPETMPAHDVTVTGTFSVNKYKLTYKVDGVEYKTFEVEYGTTITAEEEPTKEGYTFSGWSEIPETMPAHDITVTGTFEKNIIMGDVNGDGVVNVTDIVATVNYIMEKPSDGFNKEAADLNGDGEINVTDIVKMVTIIMSGDGGSSRRAAATSSNLVISGHNIQLRNAENYIAAQFDINLSDGQSISDIVLNGSSNHDLHWKMIDTNTCRVVVYSMTNAAFRVNGDNLFNIFMNGGRATISNELLIKAGNTTSIDAIRKESENGKVYDLNGRQVKTPRKGVYIINGKKMVVK